MKCLSKVSIFTENINYGDVLMYDESKAFLIVKTDSEYIAIQIFNNGNEDLGHAEYTDSSIENLKNRLYKDFGIPHRIINMKFMTVNF